jgi:hypothetical protein
MWLVMSDTTAFTMSSLSHDFKPRILCPVLADVLKKQRIKFLNPDVLYVEKRES